MKSGGGHGKSSLQKSNIGMKRKNEDAVQWPMSAKRKSKKTQNTNTT